MRKHIITHLLQKYNPLIFLIKFLLLVFEVHQFQETILLNFHSLNQNYNINYSNVVILY